jgi:cysteine desulfurase
LKRRLGIADGRGAVLYFDHNATHPLSATAKVAWLDAVERFPGNASSPHRMGQRAERALEGARERLGAILGVSAEHVVFSSGATEANNMVIAQAKRVWTSSIEHPCVIEPSEGKATRIPVDGSGLVDLSWIGDRLGTERPDLIAVMAANNETGVIQPWQKIAELCRRENVPFLCDAAQWVGKMSSGELGAATFVSGCAHKFGGPTGVGFLVCPAGFPALLRGGPQEEGRRAGTENLAGILAMVAALEERLDAISRGAIEERGAWRAQFERNLQERVAGVEILAKDAARLWNTVAVLMPEPPDCRRRWVVVMDRLGFAVSTGSACASGKEKPSHVLTAMGVPAEIAGRALRFSSGWATEEADWEKLLSGVQAAVTEMTGGGANVSVRDASVGNGEAPGHRSDPV